MKLSTFFQNQWSRFRLLPRPAWLFLLAVFLDGLLFSGWNLFFNFYFLEAGFGRDFLGQVNAIPSLAALIFGVPMGLLSDRLGRKRAMLIGFSAANVAMILMVSSRQPALILSMAFIWGMMGQLYAISHAPFMMKVSDDRSRDILFSLSFAMFPLASTLGNVLAGQLPALFGAWLGVAARSEAVYRGVLLTSVVSSFLVLVPILWIREPKKGRSPAGSADPAAPGLPGKPQTSIWHALTRRKNLLLAIPNLVIGLGAAILIPYMNLFFAERYGLGDAALGGLFSLSALLTGVACVVGPRLVGNLGGKVRVVISGQAASLVFLLIIGFSPWPWLAVVGFLARGALMNMVAPLFDAYAMEQSPESEQGAVNSLRALAWNVGWAVGPYLSGVVQQRYGFSPLFVATALLYAAAILFTWWIFERPRPSVEEDDLENAGKEAELAIGNPLL